MKKILLLLIGLTIISCGSDDADNSSEPQTFLEKYDGMGFKMLYSGNYYYFFDDTFFLADIYEYQENEGVVRYCPMFKEGLNSDDGNITGYGESFTVTILKNDTNILAYEINSFGTQTEKLTVNDSGDILTVLYNEGTDDEGLETYYKIDSSFSSICN